MKLIFDMDNTLINVREEWFSGYVDVIARAGYPTNDALALELFQAIGEYDLYSKKYDKEEMLNHINTNYHKNYNMKLIDGVIDYVSNNWVCEEDKKLSELLEYLSSKYELYILSNWFTESQITRLKHLGLDKYFKRIIGSDMYGTKPNIDAYDYFKDYENCIMIGDNPDVDLKGAKELGMKCILVDYKNKYPNYDGIRIENINDIKEVLCKQNLK